MIIKKHFLINNIFSKRITTLLVLGILFISFQTLNLTLAAYPESDEGVYAAVGQFMFRSLIPHRDFGFWHMPLLPFLSGLMMKIFGNMNLVRFIFLLINTFAVVPLYLTFQRLEKNQSAGFLAVFMYLTYHEMVHHDFRFLAVRQAANVLLIVFLYLIVNNSDKLRSWMYRGIVSILSVFLFLPSAFHLLFISLADIWRQPDKKSKLNVFQNYLILGSVVLICLLVYFLLIPNSFQQIVLDQLGRSSENRLDRLPLIFLGKFDSYLYFTGLTGLLLGVIFSKKLRPWSLAMIGIFITSGFLSSNYYPHYLSAAGPALAFGIFSLGIHIEKLACLITKKHALVIAYTTLIIIALAQLGFVFDRLYGEWRNNRQPEYYELIEALKNSPEPVLALEPIFVVEANKKLLQDFWGIFLRPPVHAKSYNRDDYQKGAAKACTILLDGKAIGIIPQSIRSEWQQKYEESFSNRWGTVLLTNNSGCLQTE